MPVLDSRWAARAEENAGDAADASAALVTFTRLRDQFDSYRENDWKARAEALSA